jgi:hypothetical protein
MIIATMATAIHLNLDRILWKILRKTRSGETSQSTFDLLSLDDFDHPSIRADIREALGDIEGAKADRATIKKLISKQQ